MSKFLSQLKDFWAKATGVNGGIIFPGEELPDPTRKSGTHQERTR